MLHSKIRPGRLLPSSCLPGLLMAWLATCQPATPAFAAPAAESPCAAVALAPQAGHYLLKLGAGKLALPVSTAPSGQGAAVAADALIVPAGAPLPQDAAGAARPAERVQAQATRFGSALVAGKAALGVQLAQWRGHDINLISSTPEGAPATPLAVLAVEASPAAASGAESPPRVSWMQLAPAPGTGSTPTQAVAVLEALYTLVFRQDPAARYCATAAAGPCNEGQWLAQDQALLKIAQRRACAMAGLPAAQRALRPAWQSLRVQATAEMRSGRLWASARLTAHEAAVPGQRLVFSRLPHSSCTAITDAHGGASCELVDQHGHDDDGDESAAMPVAVTFPGDLKPQRVLLPTSTLAPVAP